MKVLLSIKPEFANKILNGKKRFEFRKTVFKNPTVTTVVIYATKPVGKVIGEFSIETIISSCPDSLWEATSEFAGISQAFFNEYFKNHNRAYAIKVRHARRYERPLDLSEIVPNNVAPQSFRYLPQ